MSAVPSQADIEAGLRVAGRSPTEAAIEAQEIREHFELASVFDDPDAGWAFEEEDR